MENNFFMYLSCVEGFMIVMMLGWEIFWLRKMYQVLQAMPTAEQLKKMIQMIKEDRDKIADGFDSIVSAFDPIKNMLGGLFKLPTKLG